MKDRKRQRENRRMKQELIARRNMCGLSDPTPCDAVRNIVKEQEARLESQFLRAR